MLTENTRGYLQYTQAPGMQVSKGKQITRGQGLWSNFVEFTDVKKVVGFLTSNLPV